MKTRLFILINALFLVFFLLTPVSLDADEASISVYTVNYPLKYFAERIAGEHATVVFPAPKDVDPAYWMPDKKTIADYQKADLILPALLRFMMMQVTGVVADLVDKRGEVLCKPVILLQVNA